MLSKLVRIDQADFKLPTGVEDFGNYNKMPEPWVEVTRDFYFNWGTMWILDAVESRQITPIHTPELFKPGQRNGFFPVRIEWYWWGGVAVNLPQKWRVAARDTWPDNGGVIYEGEIRYFRLGCVHDFKEYKTEGMHMHYTQCTKCGKKWGYDSSG